MAANQSYTLAPIIEGGRDEALRSALSSTESLDAEELHFNPDSMRENDERAIPPRLASVEQKKLLWFRNAAINSTFILGWYCFATLLSLYNKWMFSPDYYNFQFPLFVTTVHFCVQFALASAARTFFPNSMRSPGHPTRKEYGQKLVPCAMTTGFDIGLSNLSLKTIPLSFYTMCKSSSLIFVLLFAFMFRLEAPSMFLTAVILLITVGVLLMVFTTETQAALSGAILVISASAFGGLRWSLTELLLKKREMGLDVPASTVFWLAPVMALTLVIVSASLEGFRTIFGSHFFQGAEILRTLFFVVSPGALAFFMVMSEFYILKRAGVLPMSIAGIFKEVSTIGFAAFLFGEHLSPVNISGVGITICGIALFTYHKYKKSIQSDVRLDAHGSPIQENVEPESHILLGEEPELNGSSSSDILQQSVRRADAEAVSIAGEREARSSMAVWRRESPVQRADNLG